MLHIPQYFKTNNTSGSWFAHKRHGVKWKYPIYEMLEGEGEQDTSINTLIIHEWNIYKKTHDIYLQLAELAIKENPLDPHCRYARYVIQKEIENKKSEID